MEYLLCLKERLFHPTTFIKGKKYEIISKDEYSFHVVDELKRVAYINNDFDYKTIWGEDGYFVHSSKLREHKIKKLLKNG